MSKQTVNKMGYDIIKLRWLYYDEIKFDGSYRRNRRYKSAIYPLHEVLIIMLLAVICAETLYAKIEIFGKSKKEWLGRFLELENGILDACTFRNVIKEI